MVEGSFRLGLVGCGRAAERIWVPALRAVPEARVIAAVDSRSERCEAIAREIPGCRPAERLEALLDAGTVDGLILATPLQSHYAVASQALEAGVPLLVEKPLAATVAEAIRLESLSRATATPLLVGFNRRWWSPAVRLQDLLRSAASPMRADLAFVTNGFEWGAVAGTPDLIDDLASHQVDLLRFLFNQEIGLLSATRPSRGEVRMEIQMAAGATAACRIADEGQSEESISVSAGSRMWWAHSRSDRISPGTGALRTMLDGAGVVWRKLAGRRNAMRRSFEDELRAFIRAVRQRLPVSPDAADGVAAARAVAAIRESLATGGQAVAL